MKDTAHVPGSHTSVLWPVPALEGTVSQAYRIIIGKITLQLGVNMSHMSLHNAKHWHLHTLGCHPSRRMVTKPGA